MKKKQMLAMLVMISLLQGSVYAAQDINYDFVVNEDMDFGDMMLQQTGGLGMMLDSGDTLTIAKGKTLKFDTKTYPSGGAGPFYVVVKDFGNAPKPLRVTGGNLIAISDGSGKNYAAYIQAGSGANIEVTDTNLTFDNFYYGFALQDAETIIINSETKLINNDYAIYMQNDAKFNAISDKFTIQNMNTGIYGKGTSNVILNNKETILENGSFGIYTKEDASVKVQSEKFSIIDNDYGIRSAGGNVDVVADTFLFTTSNDIDVSTAIYANGNSNVNVTANLANLNGQVSASDNAKISFLEDSDTAETQSVNVYSTLTDAVSAQSDTGEATINFETNSYINSQGDEIYHADRQGVRTVSAIRANRNSVITLDNAAGIYGDIIAGRGISDSNAQGGQITINSVDYADFKGDVLAGNSGKIYITLNNANYEGRVDDYADATLKNTVFRPEEFDVAVTEGGTVNMKLNNSNWDARGQSFVTELTFENGGSVNLVDDNEADSSGAQGNSVTIRNLEGNGTFNMTLNSADHSLGDMLYIGKNEGNQTINIVGGITGGLENISKDNPLRFATVGIDGSNLPDVQSGSVSAYTRDAGFADIEYYVDKEDFKKEDAENEKYNGNGNGEGVDKPGNDFVENKLVGERDTAVNWIITGAKELGTGGSQVSDAGKTIINMSKVNYNNAIYMDRLNKRLGEARYINPEEEQGMWVRIRHDRIGKKDAFRSQNTMYEMGYDVKQDCDNGERRVGFAIDYMDGKAEYTGIAGDGDVKRYGLWLYDTWLDDKGHYADYVAKWGHLENDFDIMARSTGEKITGDYSNNVFSVSAEYGKKNDMGNNWYFEPQAQLQLARVTGADYVTTQGTKVSLDGINSLIGRAGFRLGRDVDESSTVYIKADLLHEFLGEQNMHVEDNTFNGGQTFENKGTWYDIGFGFATAMGKNSYAFMDFEKSFGNDNDETYQINAGVQWTF